MGRSLGNWSVHKDTLILAPSPDPVSRRNGELAISMEMGNGMGDINDFLSFSHYNVYH